MLQKKPFQAFKALALMTLPLISSVATADDGCTNSGGQIDLQCKLENILTTKIAATGGAALLSDAFAKAKGDGTDYSAYTLKPGSLSYPDNNFMSGTMNVTNVTQTLNPIAATSNAMGECYNATFDVSVGAGLTAQNGETFTSDSSLTTDTTVTVESAYAGMSINATTEITTNDSKSSSVTTQSLSTTTSGNSSSDTLTCENANQPYFVQMNGDINQTIFTTSSGSQDIPYTYEVFPHSDNYYNKAKFTATIQKADTRIPGPSISVDFLDKNQKVQATYSRGSTFPTNNGIYFYAESDPQSPFIDKIKKGGNYTPYYFRVNCPSGTSMSTTSVKFRNDKDDWHTVVAGCGDVTRQPDNWRSGMIGLELKNWSTTGSAPAEQTLTNVLVIDIIKEQKDASYTMNGTYNAVGMPNLVVSMSSNRVTWDDIYNKGKMNRDVLKLCKEYMDYTNIDDVKKHWRQANKCGDRTKSTTTAGNVGATADGSDKKTRRSLKADKDGKIAGRRATADAANTEQGQHRKIHRKEILKFDNWTLTDKNGNKIDNIGINQRPRTRSN